MIFSYLAYPPVKSSVLTVLLTVVIITGHFTICNCKGGVIIAEDRTNITQNRVGLYQNDFIVQNGSLIFIADVKLPIMDFETSVYIPENISLSVTKTFIAGNITINGILEIEDITEAEINVSDCINIGSNSTLQVNNMSQQKNYSLFTGCVIGEFKNVIVDGYPSSCVKISYLEGIFIQNDCSTTLQSMKMLKFVYYSIVAIRIALIIGMVLSLVGFGVTSCIIYKVHQVQEAEYRASKNSS